MARNEMPRLGRWASTAAVGFGCLVFTGVAEAQSRGRARGPSQQQIRQMQQQMQYQQQEMMRVQAETAAKQQELVAKFDENGDGKLFGKEKGKYDAYMRDVRLGREPNPFAGIKPAGQGPRSK
jgi:hypothetical protein